VLTVRGKTTVEKASHKATLKSMMPPTTEREANISVTSGLSFAHEDLAVAVPFPHGSVVRSQKVRNDLMREYHSANIIEQGIGAGRHTRCPRNAGVSFSSEDKTQEKSQNVK
jgi:hypothetical protein